MIPGPGRGRVLLFALLPLAALACGSKPQLAPVSGVVKLDGVPLPDAVVEFLPDPDKGTAGPRSAATTDEQGRFRLTCDDGREGAVVGFHRVLIRDARAFPPPRARPGAVTATPASRVPERYGKVTDTPLSLEVKADSPTVTLEVTSKSRPR
jgi:hypothetical protein